MALFSDAQPVARANTMERSRLLALAAECLISAALIAVVVVIATGLARPSLMVRADDANALRFLAGFWQPERGEGEDFRWTTGQASIRLFGFEQQAPVLTTLRLSASYPTDEAQPLVTLGKGVVVPVGPTWRDYHVLLPAPPRGTEGRSIQLNSSTYQPPTDPRVVGVAFAWLSARPLPATPIDSLPDGERLGFWVAAGVLAFLGVRVRCGKGWAWVVVAAATLVLGVSLAIAPSTVAFWLPTVWLPILVGALGLFFAGPARSLIGSLSQPFAVGFGCVAVGAALLLLPLHQPSTSVLGWALAIAGTGCVARTLPLPAPTEAPLPPKVPMVALLGCTLLALALRLVDLDALPYGMWRDEARHGLLALQILNDPTFRPIYVSVVADIPALLFYLAALPIGLFGNHPWTIRFIPALAGALTPLALYFFTRPIFGMRVALLAAWLLAAMSWHITLSRLAFAASLGPPLTLLALGSVWRAFGQNSAYGGRDGTEGKPPRACLAWAALAGAAAGLAIYTYHPARLTPFVVALSVAVLLGPRLGAWRRAFPALLVLGSALLIVAAPLGWYALTNPDDFARRIGQTSLFNQDMIGGRAPLALLTENVRLYAGLWNERGDRIARHNLPNAPMLDPLLGTMFVFGVGLAFAEWRDRRFQVVLVWLAVALVPGVLASEAPHAVRTVEAIAPTVVLAAVGGYALFAWARVQVPWRGALRAIAIACVSLVVLINTWRYFVEWRSYPFVDDFYPTETETGAAMQHLAARQAPDGQPYMFLMSKDGMTDDVLNYLAYGIPRDFAPSQPLPPERRPHSLLVLYGPSVPGAAERARVLFDGNTRLVQQGPLDREGAPMYVVYGEGT